LRHQPVKNIRIRLNAVPEELGRRILPVAAGWLAFGESLGNHIARLRKLPLVADSRLGFLAEMFRMGPQS
jgi:hypothetical protein